MRSCTLIIVLSAAALAAGSIPPRKQFLLNQNLDLLENPAKNINTLKPTNTPRFFVDPVDKVAYRLSNNTYPIHYDINIKTHVHKADFAFSGKVKIEIAVRVATSSIQIHHRQLTIGNVDLLNSQGVVIVPNIATSYRPIEEFLNIPVPQLIVGQIYYLEIEFTGELRGDNGGFYKSSYKNPQGHEVWLATTQFESTDARHGFPCYDEPSIRAQYTISIEHHNSYTAISNMPQESRLAGGEPEYVITKFEKSLKFQTYLVAYVISDFKYIENLTAVPPQRVFATHTQIEDREADFALEFGVKVVEKLENHLGVKYIMPKLDQISMPDFAAGAMENFGLVTYRETALLFNNKTSNNDDKFWIASVIAHEYAHQWFGDHVAPTWWQFLWLNEGFATLFESYATGLVYPEWRSMETFVTGVVHYVFQSDSLNPRPMSDYVESPGAIGNLFDDVPYEKAGAVLRMLQTVMTEETFAKGLKLYLDENRENNANPDDLYRNLQRAIDDELLVLTPNITGFMKTWEMQAGFPVVNVARSNNALTITQQRYFRDPSSSSPVIWWIPLNYVVGSNPDFSKTTPDFWLIEKSSTIQNSSAPNRKFWNSEDWILFNIKETGYYRVNYDLNLWKLLSDELTIGNHTKIDVVNRAQLIDDSFNLARSQHLQYSVPFDILSYLKLENEYDPWTAASRALSFLRPTLFNSQYFNLFQKFMLENVNLLFTKYGLTSKSSDRFLDKFARNIAINWACSTSHVQCLSDTTALMVRVVDDHKIEPDLQFSIYCNGLRQATKATFDKFWEQALLSAEKSVMLSALGCSHDSALLKNYLETTMAAPNQDNQLLVVDAILGNGQLAGLNVLIDYVTKNSSFVFVRVKELVVNSIAMRVVNSDQLSKLKNILISLEMQAADQPKILKVATDRLDWINKNVPTIETWLRNHFELPEVSTIIAETTTSSSSAVFIPIFMVLSSILANFYMN